MVYSENRETGEKGLKRVVRTFVNRTSRLVHVSVGGETVSCTTEHPFYVSGKGWTGASGLVAGDVLVLESGETAVVESVEIEALEDSVEVYNFEVEDWHAYYVGDCGVLVHNRCSPDIPGGAENKLDWSNTSKKGQTSLDHVQRHATPNYQ